MHIDHAVIWVENAERSLDFYVNTLGFDSVREEEFSEGKVRFPSEGINENTIVDIVECVK